MQDYLREISGTLARKNERKNTILFKLSKRREEEERLAKFGLKVRPSHPHEVHDLHAVKHFLFEAKREVGTAISHLQNPALVSIDRDGEDAVRAMNDKVNRLLWKQQQWEARLEELGNPPEVKEDQRYKPPISRREKQFFGCARLLPEAVKHISKSDQLLQDSQSGTKRDRSALQENFLDRPPYVDVAAGDKFVNTANNIHQDPLPPSKRPATSIAQPSASYSTQINEISTRNASREDQEQKLRIAEAKAEESHKDTRIFAADPKINSDSRATQSLHYTPTIYISDYKDPAVLHLPTEEHYKNALLIARRKKLLSQITQIS